MYNVLMAWAIKTIYTSKWVQMDPQQLPKLSKFYSICNTYVMQKNVKGMDTNPTLSSLRVKGNWACWNTKYFQLTKDELIKYHSFHSFIHSFIHSGHFYSAPSSPLP